MGCWTPVQTTGEGGQWQARLLSPDGSRFEVLFEGEAQGVVDWAMTGQHNVANALATLQRPAMLAWCRPWVSKA